jgi:hypothetical protein
MVAAADGKAARPGLLSRITFSYMDPLLKLGAQRPLKVTDLPPVWHDHDADTAFNDFQTHWKVTLPPHPLIRHAPPGTDDAEGSRSGGRSLRYPGDPRITHISHAHSRYSHLPHLAHSGATLKASSCRHDGRLLSNPCVQSSWGRARLMRRPSVPASTSALPM